MDFTSGELDAYDLHFHGDDGDFLAVAVMSFLFIFLCVLDRAVMYGHKVFVQLNVGKLQDERNTFPCKTGIHQKGFLQSLHSSLLYFTGLRLKTGLQCVKPPMKHNQRIIAHDLKRSRRQTSHCVSDSYKRKRLHLNAAGKNKEDLNATGNELNTGKNNKDLNATENESNATGKNNEDLNATENDLNATGNELNATRKNKEDVKTGKSSTIVYGHDKVVTDLDVKQKHRELNVAVEAKKIKDEAINPEPSSEGVPSLGQQCVTKSTQTFPAPVYNTIVEYLTKRVRKITTDCARRSLVNLFTEKIDEQMTKEASRRENARSDELSRMGKKDSVDYFTRVKSYMLIELIGEMYSKDTKENKRRSDNMNEKIAEQRQNHVKRWLNEIFRIKSVTPITLEINRDCMADVYPQEKTKRTKVKKSKIHKEPQTEIIKEEPVRHPESFSRRDFNPYSLPYKMNKKSNGHGGCGDNGMLENSPLKLSSNVKENKERMCLARYDQCIEPLELRNSQMVGNVAITHGESENILPCKLENKSKHSITKRVVFDKVIQQLQSQLSKKDNPSNYHLTDLFRNLKLMGDTDESQTSLALSVRDIHMIEDLRRQNNNCESLLRLNRESAKWRCENSTSHLDNTRPEQSNVSQMSDRKERAIGRRDAKKQMLNGKANLCRRKYRRKKFHRTNITSVLSNKTPRPNYCFVPMCKCLEHHQRQNKYRDCVGSAADHDIVILLNKRRKLGLLRQRARRWNGDSSSKDTVSGNSQDSAFSFL